MEENSKQEPLKKDKIIIKEQKRYSLFSNNKKEITKEEYDHRVKNSFFFMRSPLSNQIVLQIRDDSKKRKKKKKKKQKSFFHLQFKSETKNDKLISSNKTRNKQLKNSYINLQPRKTWLNCRKIYNKCLIGYNPDEYTKENRFQKNISGEGLLGNNQLRLNLQDTIDPLPINEKPLIRFTKKGGRTKSLHDINFAKNKLIFKSINMNINFRPLHRSNFIKCMNKSISLNFMNKGISDILEKRNLEDFQALKKFNFDKDKTKKEERRKKLRINLAYRFERKRLSLVNIKLPKLEIAKRMGISLDFQYKIHPFFYTGGKEQKDSEDEDDDDNNNKVNDLEIINTEKGNFVIKESNVKKEETENNIDDQSVFNFFCLKNLLRLEQFHIFGLISGKGNDSKKCSRLLKKILVDKFSDEKNYINDEILEKNRFKQKIDYILFILTNDKFKFIKDIFNSLEREFIKMGIDIENTGATLSVIIFIKDKIISIKLGDIHPYFIYKVFDEKSNNNLMVRNPHYDHNLNNILEQDRLEENKCEINVSKNKLGKKNYKIEYKYDEEIQNILNNENIKNTRMLGFKKLNKIGIINNPDIQTFSMDIGKIEKDRLGAKRINMNPHASDTLFYALIKKKGIIFSDIILKFVLIGNDELFDIMKNSYYIKEINDAIIKDEIDNKNVDNIKYFFNLNKTIRKLVNNSTELNNKFTCDKNIKDTSLALIALEEN